MVNKAVTVFSIFLYKTEGLNLSGLKLIYVRKNKSGTSILQFLPNSC